MLGGAAFGRIDDFAREQGFARRGEPLCRSANGDEACQHSVEMRLRPVEIDPAKLQNAESLVRRARTGFERLHVVRVDRVPFLACHARRHSRPPRKNHPRLTRRAPPERSELRWLSAMLADRAPDPIRRSAAAALLRLIIEVPLIAWVIRSFVFAPFSIPSGSMLPTLFIGDYVTVAKWPYGFSRYSFPWGFPSFDGRIFGSLPERGDVVVFRAPGAKKTSSSA